VKFEFDNFNHRKLSYKGNVIYTYYSEYSFENINYFLFPFLLSSYVGGGSYGKL